MKLNKTYLKWALLGVIAISFAYNYSSIFDPKPDENGDNLCYYFLGKNLSEGNGYILGYEPTRTPHTHFPPGYPVFMALMMKIFPDSMPAMKFMNGLLLLLSLCLLFRFINKTVPRYGLLVAFMTCFFSTLHPVMLRWSTIMMSEMLYIVVSLGILNLCIELDMDGLRRKEKKQIVMLALLCLLVVVTYFIRTMGVSVILAAVLFFVALAVKKFIKQKEDWKSWFVPVAVSVLLVLSLFVAKWSWDARNHRINPAYSGAYTENFLSKPGDEGKMDTLDDWKARIGTNLKSFVAYYIPQSLFKPGEAMYKFYRQIESDDFSWVLGGSVILLMVGGLIYLSSARWIIIMYIFITYGILMLYQEQASGIRYMVPILPLLIFAFISGIISVLDLITGRFLKSKREILVGIVVAILFIPYPSVLAKNQEKIKQIASIKSVMKYSDELPYKQYVQASMFFKKAPSDYLVACRKPEVFYYYSKYHHCVVIPKSGTPEDVIKYLTENKVNGLIIDCWSLRAIKVFKPAVEAYPEHFRLIAHYGSKDRPTYVMSFIP